MSEQKYKSMFTLSPRRPISFYYTWLPITTTLTFLFPAYFHYKNGEKFSTFLLILLAIFRASYYVPKRPEFTTLWTYDVFYLLTLIFVYLNLLYEEFLYRQSLTTHMMAFICVYKSATWLINYGGGWQIDDLNPKQRMPGGAAAALWNICMLGLFMVHLFVRDVAHPIQMVDFTKGFFWGFYVLYLWTNYNGFLWTMSDILGQQYVSIHMAPFLNSLSSRGVWATPPMRSRHHQFQKEKEDVSHTEVD